MSLQETEEIDIGTPEHQIIEEDEDDKGSAGKKMEGEESRKAGKPSSRIPTFQSSLARKRTTTQIAESQLPSKPEGSSRECQMKERGISSAETLRTKLPVFGDRETALPVLSARMHSHSTDDLSVTDMSDAVLSETSEATSLPLKRNHSPEPNDSESRTDSLHRPSLRVETESDTDSALQPPVEPQVAITGFQWEDKQESDTVAQDDLKQKLSKVIQGIGDELEERLVKESPLALVMEEAQRQGPTLKKPSAEVSSETVLKQTNVDAPARSKTVHSRQTEHQNSTSSRV